MRKMFIRRGFTLAEVLVTVTIVAVLAAVMVPAVINQVGKGDIPSIADDLGGIRTAITTFAADTRQFPGKLSDLGGSQLAPGNDITPTAYTADALVHYHGPYAPISSGHIGPTGAIFANVLYKVGRAICLQDSLASGISGASQISPSQIAQIKTAIDQIPLVTPIGTTGVNSTGSVTWTQQTNGSNVTTVDPGSVKVCLTSF
jgi:prepilin-type N-terminal cleavage/methylation domain-containing protein